MVVAGPSSLSKATGIPSLSHTLSMVSVELSRWASQEEIIKAVDQICCIVGGHDPVKGRGKLVEDVRS